jgi:endonuclease/exonuclease/phosphatase family metal-dependent hydrolase
MWRSINRSVPRAITERRNMSTYAGDLISGAMLFNKRFQSQWAADGYRDYLTADVVPRETGKTVLSRLLRRPATSAAHDGADGAGGGGSSGSNAAYGVGAYSGGAPSLSPPGATAAGIGESFSTAALSSRSIVCDPATFRPLLGTDTAVCTLEVGDALLVRTDWTSRIVRSGAAGYDARGFFDIRRGYVWADIEVTSGAPPVRFVTTHLESAAPRSATAEQAKQLVLELDPNIRTVVMGDFNADPRVFPGNSKQTSNAYWVMRGAGFLDAGPGPEEDTAFGGDARILFAEEKKWQGHPARFRQGFNERLDFVFVRPPPAHVCRAEIIGRTPPFGSDHAGIVVDLTF